jgi:membrane protease subunit HflK
VIRARGDAERFLTVLTEYAKAPKVTRERIYLESAEQFLAHTKKFVPDGGKSGILPVLPLQGLQDTTAGTPPIAVPEPPTPKKGK